MQLSDGAGAEAPPPTRTGTDAFADNTAGPCGRSDAVFDTSKGVDALGEFEAVRSRRGASAGLSPRPIGTEPFADTLPCHRRAVTAWDVCDPQPPAAAGVCAAAVAIEKNPRASVASTIRVIRPPFSAP